MMKGNTLFTVLTLAAGALVSTTGIAQDNQMNDAATGQPHHQIEMDKAERLQPDSAAFGKMDKNSDGSLSHEEFKKYDTNQNFSQIDSNKDNKISQDELSQTYTEDSQNLSEQMN
ncbi:MAG TPA: hypothetical protein DHW71_13735 [Gammaproteobacteria bacterium]|nr:hypothetical protein [Gammaproteobacteria bacterium]HCK94051.1 hypothetical protein [Gammaproteobacteria bacterium]|tara:strand:- start:741 stop:1085 length:345 start_codon:yes stop_codon:yes gene_type:complete